MVFALLALIILAGIVSIGLLKKGPTNKVSGQLSANDFEIIELMETD